MCRCCCIKEAEIGSVCVRCAAAQAVALDEELTAD